MNFIKKLSLVFLLILGLLPFSVEAKTLEGVIRNINVDSSKGFGLDVPPLIRVYTNANTKFKKTSLEELKIGDRVVVKGEEGQTGTFLASSVKIIGHLEEKRNLDKSGIKIKLEQSFLMRQGQSASLDEKGKPSLHLKAKSFINTLCNGRDCSGDGYVGMHMEVTSDGQSQEVFLRSKGQRKPISPVYLDIGTYRIQLIETGEDVVLLVVRSR
ncbi:MAG: hypothetical protein KDK66_06275 [Deltaproteobacteria bacterium]|nr:hypothetical protein [Deltaproteobacteria bacterium]